MTSNPFVLTVEQKELTKIMKLELPRKEGPAFMNVSPGPFCFLRIIIYGGEGVNKL